MKNNEFLDVYMAKVRFSEQALITKTYTAIGIGVLIILWYILIIINETALHASVERSRSYIEINQAATRYYEINSSYQGLSFDTLIQWNLISEYHLERLGSTLGGHYDLFIDPSKTSFSITPGGVFWGYAPTALAAAYDVAILNDEGFIFTPDVLSNH